MVTLEDGREVRMMTYHPSEYTDLKRLLDTTDEYDDERDNPATLAAATRVHPDAVLNAHVLTPTIKGGHETSEIVGTIRIDDDDLISRLLVDPKYRGRGIGKLAVLTAIKHLIVKRKKSKAEVLIDSKRDDLRHYYEKLGFGLSPEAVYEVLGLIYRNGSEIDSLSAVRLADKPDGYVWKDSRDELKDRPAYWDVEMATNAQEVQWQRAFEAIYSVLTQGNDSPTCIMSVAEFNKCMLQSGIPDFERSTIRGDSIDNEGASVGIAFSQPHKYNVSPVSSSSEETVFYAEGWAAIASRRQNDKAPYSFLKVTSQPHNRPYQIPDVRGYYVGREKETNKLVPFKIGYTTVSLSGSLQPELFKVTQSERASLMAQLLEGMKALNSYEPYDPSRSYSQRGIPSSLRLTSVDLEET